MYLQIDQFEQAFLFQSSLPHGVGSKDIGLDRGQLGDTRLVKFKRVGNKVFLKQLNTYYRADSENLLEQQAIDEAFASSIIWGFTVASESRNKKSNKVLIDYTPFLLSDIHHISDKLKSTKQGSFKVDASHSALYAKRTKAFPDNTELEAMVTFKGSGAGDYLKSVTLDASAVTVHLHHSLIKRLIPRHRLVKKYAGDKQSKAVEPIVYYIDAGVPEPIRTALIEGAMWW